MKQIVLIFTGIIFVLSVQNISAQCYMDRHNTNWFDGWISCSPSDNPNPVRGESHWIAYNFGEVYELGQSHFWNSNDPEYLSYGISEVVIDYSVDGETWFEMGEFSFDLASGESIYEGEEGPDFTGLTVQYLIITILSNHGGECYGFSEARFDVLDVVTHTNDVMNDCYDVKIYPNPFSELAKVYINTKCKGRITYSIMNSIGEIVYQGMINNVNRINSIDLSLLNLSNGMYYFIVNQNDVVERFSVVKMDGE